MRRIMFIALLVCAFSALAATPALAHGAYEHGDLSIVTGFATEPAFVGQPNAVQLQISKGGKAVTDLRQGDLKVDVGFNGQRTTLTLEPQFEVGEWGTPGDYRASFIPTQPGPYTFDISGTVDGEKVSYSMTSGPKTFSEVEDTSSALFPPVQAPTATELATKIDQEADRTTDAIASANNAADSARTIAIVAAVLAIVALVAAVVAITRARRSTLA
jgi:hypothetical protein